MPIGTKKARPGSWRDPRLAVGVLLVIVAVSLTLWTIRTATYQEKYYVATQAVEPGKALSDQALRQVSANLGSAKGNYLPAGQIPRGAVTTRRLAPGEFVSRSAISTDNPDLRDIVIEPATALPANLQAGAAIQLWQLPVKTAQDGEPAQEISGGAILGEVQKTDASMGSRGRFSVGVRVPRSDVPRVLEAIGQGASLVVIADNR